MGQTKPRTFEGGPKDLKPMLGGDAVKATRKNMEEEAPDKFHRIERHLFDLIVVLWIPPAETHATLLQAEQSPTADRHSRSALLVGVRGVLFLDHIL